MTNQQIANFLKRNKLVAIPLGNKDGGYSAITGRMLAAETIDDTEYRIYWDAHEQQYCLERYDDPSGEYLQLLFAKTVEALRKQAIAEVIKSSDIQPSLLRKVDALLATIPNDHPIP